MDRNYNNIVALLQGFPMNTKISDTGMTVLHAACVALSQNIPEQIYIYQMIIGSGADINQRDNVGRAPLHTAARNGNQLAVWILLSLPTI